MTLPQEDAESAEVALQQEPKEDINMLDLEAPAPADRAEPLAPEEIYRMTRPYIDSFITDEPEFYRWYQYGGKPHQRPLEPDELRRTLEERG